MRRRNIDNSHNYLPSLLPPKMAPTSALALASAVESVLLGRYAPAYRITDSSFLRILALFWIHMTLWYTWSMLIYPNFFSPLRNLPHPKVN